MTDISSEPSDKDGSGSIDAASTTSPDITTNDDPLTESPDDRGTALHADGAEKRPQAQIDLTDDVILALSDRVASMERMHADFHERAAAQEDIIRRMHSAIEEYQRNQVRELLRPVLMSIAEISAIAQTMASPTEPDDLEAWRQDLDYFCSRLETSVDDLGFRSVAAKSLVEFDPRVHEASGNHVDTADSTLDNCIALVRRQGYIAHDSSHPFIYAKVDVYRHAATQGESSGELRERENANSAGMQSEGKGIETQ